MTHPRYFIYIISRGGVSLKKLTMYDVFRAISFRGFVCHEGTRHLLVIEIPSCDVKGGNWSHEINILLKIIFYYNVI